MGSIGSNSLPKYSNENGVILESTVKADPRYQQIEDIFNEHKQLRTEWFTDEDNRRRSRQVNKGAGYLATEFMRQIMRDEEEGKSSGVLRSISIDKETEDLRSKVSAYRKALKALGYKVTKVENNDHHRKGYRAVRGERVYASTSYWRSLHYEKIKK